MLIQLKSKDSKDGSWQQKPLSMKISLFYKSYITKAYSFLMIMSILAGVPLSANAGFFSDLASSVFGGTQVQADEQTSEVSGTVRNSQTIPLLESSLNPDFKNKDASEDIILVQDDSFIYTEESFIPDVPFEKSTLSDKINVYTVKEGDTLSEIAEMFDISVNTIRWENNISGQTVKIGQKLNILPVTGVKHIVKKGDTVTKIATKYEAEVEDMLIFNGIEKSDGLKQGDIIFVPNGIIKPVVVVKPTITPGKVSVSNTKAPTGYYLKPVPGPVTSPYGSRKGGFHYGVDFGGPRGTPVVAAASGVVTKVISGCKEGSRNCGGRYGNYIVLTHTNGTSTFYAHLSKASVSIGQTVSQGEVIGALGNTGRSTGPHIHFEIRNSNGSAMKPVF